MTTTAIATLPSGSDPAQWSPEEKALVEAAGLVHVDRDGTKTPAPRPVVAAFLQHCQRTHLDPFARQIYSIARKSKGELKWMTQVSIDGARLVAERTGKYEGQTTPEFTADGVTWTDTWLSTDFPKAARVGVFRAGFREALYAVALWEAYAVLDYNGNVSAMWKKMGPLMLAKCAEMLALRKAFPQDLSGLYSSEEMDQAGAPLPVVRQAEAPSTRYKAVMADKPAADGEVAYDVVSESIKPATVTKDWVALAAEMGTEQHLTDLANEADALGEIGLLVSEKDGKVIDVLKRRRAEILAAAVTPPLVDVAPAKSGKRNWTRDARAKETRAEVLELAREAVAKGAPVQTIEELEAIANTLPEPESAAPVTGWAVAEIPPDEPEWNAEQNEYVQEPEQ